MYKKFLVSMLLTVALAGCGHQSSDKQGDQTDTALPVQDQITNPAPVNGVDQGQQPVSPSTVEPTQPAPTTPDTTTPAAGASTTTTPVTPSTTTPTIPTPDNKDTSINTEGTGTK